MDQFLHISVREGDRRREAPVRSSLRLAIRAGAGWLILLAAATTGRGGERISLDGEWECRLDSTAFVPVQVPSSREPRGTTTMYRLVFRPPDRVTGVTLLCFDGVVGQATVSLNGSELGRHGSYTPFNFDVSSVLRVGQENELTVAIDDRMDATTIPGGAAWVNYSGITRSVYLASGRGALLLSVEPQYEFLNGLSGVRGEVRVTAASRPGERVSFQGALLDGALDNWTIVTLLDPATDAVTGPDGIASASLSFAASGVQLWSPESPRLYHWYIVATTAASGPPDEMLRETGFRDVRIEGNDVVLNGEPVFLRGFCRHDVYPGKGFVGSDAQMEADMRQIKATGANYVRLIHYPHHPRILELADRIGLMVSEELPAWANFWDPKIREDLYRMMREMIRRDMVHPSIFLWISGNSSARAMPYALEARELARSLDRNRLTSFVIDNEACDAEAIAADSEFVRKAGLDLYMKNTYWFPYEATLVDAWRRLPKDLPMILSEFGTEGNDREPTIDGDGGQAWRSEAYQAATIHGILEAWRPHLTYYSGEHITGMTLFNYQDIDWPGIRQYWPGHAPALHFGAVHQDRTPKPVLSILTEFYSTLPRSFVGLPAAGDSSLHQCFAAAFNLGSGVNTDLTEGGPSLSSDGQTCFFAADGPSHRGLPTVFFARRTGDQYGEPQPLAMPPETDPLAFRFAPCISPDGAELYFTRAVWIDLLGRYDPRAVLMSQVRIWRSTLMDGAWSIPQDAGDVVNSPDAGVKTSDPHLSADGGALYFSSDRPGGFGGMDLWLSRRIGGAWTAAINLGSSVNSAFEDSEPSVSADGRMLFFSSDRPGGLGCRDIWVSQSENGDWAAPRNLGPELNSPGDDREPELSRNGKYLLFSSVRANGHGLVDLWAARSVEVPGDIDRDGDVDGDDFSVFAACALGPSVAYTDDCAGGDLDRDLDVDMDDFGVLQRCYSGTRRPASPRCGY